jgi:hypothetical protein
MTDLLTRPAPAPGTTDVLRRVRLGASRLDPRRTRTRRRARRRWLGACLAGVATAVIGLGVCIAVVLAGWAGSGDGDGALAGPLRAGGLAWLIGHGSGVRTQSADVTATPLGLTLSLAVLAFAVARRVRVGTRTREGRPARGASDVAVRVVCFATAYTLVVLAVEALGSVAGVHVHQYRSLLVAWVLSAGAAALGLVGPRTAMDRAYRKLPFTVLAVGRGAVAGCCVVLLGTVGVFTTLLLLSVGRFADLVARLDPTWPGAVLLLVTFVLALPNVLGLTAAVLLGPGFALGEGTTVTATSVTIGSLPAWPPLAVLPDTGPMPEWAVALLAVPVVAGMTAGWLAAAGSPGGPLHRLMAAVAAGLLAGLLVGGWVLASAGALGPGRMAEAGALVACLPVALATLGAGALIGGCAHLVAGRVHR